MGEETNRWLKVDHILDEVLDLGPEERRRKVEVLCEGDDALQDEILRMLEDGGGTDTFLESGGALAGGVWRSIASREKGDEGLQRGARVGPYRIIRELGRGGMAVVYLGERADGVYTQAVAIKVVKRGTDTDEVVQRFATERQILASLNHPNIARLLDGGVLEDGRPYLVMEYVEGETIADYCRKRGVGLQARLGLLMDVGRAVSFAHRNLVVHRDLKPSNILVTGDGTVKLMDFGIAKMLDPQDGLRTRTHMMLMTPEYASPEQVLGDAITTATDVYQLGLVMYRVLTEQKAQAFSRVSLTEVRRVVCEVEPPRPSLAKGERAQDARALRGDLDTIILHALKKQPERRYASVDQLVDDIERHLSGQPVRAQRDTFRYRAGKFLRRNAFAVGAATLVLVTITALVTFYTLRLTEERDRATVEATKAKMVSDYMVNIFNMSAPGESGELTVRDALARGIAALPTRLKDQPEVRATMLVSIGRVYRQLNDMETALPLLEEALALRESVFGGDNHEEMAEALTNLGANLYTMGRYNESQPYLERAAEARRAIGSPNLGTSLNELGNLYKTLGAYEQARGIFDESLEVMIQSKGPNHHLVSLQLINMGNMEVEIDNLHLGRENLERAATSLEDSEGKLRLLEAVALGSLGDLERELGDLPAAALRLGQSRRILDEILDDTHHFIGWISECEGDLQMAKGEPEAALASYRAAVAIYQGEGRGESESSAWTRVGRALLAQGDRSGARDAGHRSLGLLEEELEAEHTATAEPLMLMADVALADDLPEEALAQASAAEAVVLEGMPQGHRFLIETAMKKARAFAALKRPEDVEGRIAYAEGLAAASHQGRYRPRLAALRAELLPEASP